VTTARLRLGLGLLTGLLGLVAMVRLVAGAFSGGMSQFAWAVTLVAMVPWVVYVSWRARRSRLTPRGLAAVLLLDLVGLVAVWLFVFGPVLALGLSFAAFAVLWTADRPRRSAAGESRFVRVEELRRPEPDEDEDDQDDDEDDDSRR
jgi:hypothetical protein